MPYEIVYSPEAIEHLKFLTKRQQQTILDGIDEQLTYEPARETRKRKRLRENLLAKWELRVENLRAFYNVLEDPTPLVEVIAIGIKQGNRLFIGGREYVL